MNTQPRVKELQTAQGCRIVETGYRFELRDRYIAQSILTGLVDKPDVPTLEQAHDIIAWAQGGRVR